MANILSGTIGFVAPCDGACEECNKVGKVVRFRLAGRPFGAASECLLCWEHFRLNTDILMEMGLLRRHPRERVSRTSWPDGRRTGPIHEGVDDGRATTTTYSSGRGRAYSRGESMSEGETWGVSENTTETRSARD